MSDRLREVIASGGTALGACCQMPCAFVPELLAHTGFDFILIDCQHGLIGYDEMVRMLQAVGTISTPMVRVLRNDAGHIGQVLDAGAVGVVVPLIESRADAEHAVAAARYPPAGVRSMGPLRAARPLREGPQVNRGRFGPEMDQEVLRFMLIESARGAEAAEEICSCPGVDGILIGPDDLALSMGIGLATKHPAQEAAIRHILTVARRSGLIAMVGVRTLEDAQGRVGEGANAVVLGTDYSWIRSAATAVLDGARWQLTSLDA